MASLTIVYHKKVPTTPRPAFVYRCPICYSAIHVEGGIYKNPFGLDERVVNKTMEQAIRCRRRGIRVTTFMLTSDPELKRFVENFTEACRGQAYFADSTRIESFVLVDFMRNRRRRVR